MVLYLCFFINIILIIIKVIYYKKRREENNENCTPGELADNRKDLIKNGFDEDEKIFEKTSNLNGRTININMIIRIEDIIKNKGKK